MPRFSPGTCGCCGEQCDCFLCAAGNWQCIEATISGFSSGDLSTGPCYHCANFNGRVKLAYEGSNGSDTCTWIGSLCRPDDPDALFDSCGVDSVRGRIVRTGTVGSYSYKFILELLDDTTAKVAWEYDWGNLGSALPDCEDFNLTCAFISNTLDCEDPDDALVKKFGGQCVGMGTSINTCAACQEVDYAFPWYVPGNYSDVSGKGPRFVSVSIAGVTSINCPDCTDECEGCVADCGAEPECRDDFACGCYEICEGSAWDDPFCQACWAACEIAYPTCYNEHVAYQACVSACDAGCAECESCQECPGCNEQLSFRMIGGSSGALGVCVWTKLCNSSEQLCTGVFDSTPVTFSLAQGVDAGPPYNIVAQVRLNDSVRWTQTICADCYDPPGTNTLDCLDWAAMAAGWTLEVLDADAEACTWDTATVTVTPELPVAIKCLPRPNICPACEGPETNWTRYLLVTITDHWDSVDCADDRCDAAIGDFILESTGFNGCKYQYFFPAEDGGCTLDTDYCCHSYLEATITDNAAGGVDVDVFLYSSPNDITNPGGSYWVTKWKLTIPYLYGGGGPAVINCSAIDDDADFIEQDAGDADEYCEWLDAAAVHVESIVL